MQKVINIITGLLLGLTPLLAAAFMGIFFYSAFPTLMGILVPIALVLLSIWLGVSIFNRIQIVGPMEFITAVRASPEADNLEITPDSETKRRQPAHLAGLINTKENLLKSGAIRIYGDWFGKPFDNKHEIISAEFDQNSNILNLNFLNSERLEAHNPTHVFESSTFLKIIDAERVRFSFYNQDNPQGAKPLYFLDYRKENKTIKTKTNVDWYRPIFDVSLSAPALMIFG